MRERTRIEDMTLERHSNKTLFVLSRIINKLLELPSHRFSFGILQPRIALSMEHTSVEDFQDYHNHQPVGEIDGVLRASPEPLDQKTTYTGRAFEDDEASLSGSAHQPSSSDEAVFDYPTRTSSPRTSHGSEDDISILESSYEHQHQHQHQHHSSSPFTPLKTRSPFRNPSSVRAMQMDITPPHLASPPSSQPRHKNLTPSRQGTPRSLRSHRAAMGSPSKLSPSKKVRREYPLVLLHVTLLPIPLSYSPEILEAVLPPSILANWKLLQEKATDTVLERGVLIPHPREDYDLLEERLLESLELKTPRILKCGHFHLSPEEEADIAADSDTDHDDEADDADICLDCGRRIRDGKYGNTGTGSKRWDLKLFAANGLMRAGAWAAAWREMERVDVEILPWMEEDMKRELELRGEEEERAKVGQADAEREQGIAGLDEERLREIYGDDAAAQAFVDGFGDEMPVAPSTSQRPPARHSKKASEDVPLWDLFRNYLYRSGQDRRNLAILFLSIVVLFLSIGPLSAGRTDKGIQRVNENISTPVPHAAAYATDSPFKVSASVASASASASAGASSTTPSPSPPSDAQEREEPDQESSWIETAEDVAREMFED